MSQRERACPIQPICSNLDSEFSRPSQNRDSGCVGAYQQTEIATRVNKELSLTPGLSDPEAPALTRCCSREKRSVVFNIGCHSINWNTAAPCLKTINDSDKHYIFTLLSKVKCSVLNCYSIGSISALNAENEADPPHSPPHHHHDGSPAFKQVAASVSQVLFKKEEEFYGKESTFTAFY